MNNTLPSTAPNFAVETQRDYIMNAIFGAIEIQDEEIKELALANLAEVPSVGYLYLTNYIQKIGEITMSLL